MKAPSRSLRPSAGLFLVLLGLTMGFLAPAHGQDRPVSTLGASTQTTLPIWVPTGNLNTPRTDHTATLLPNGKVLVVGGYDGDALGSAELYDTNVYDTAIGYWSVTGSLNNAPAYHTATLLQNGKVLVVGASPDWPPIAISELYDPATGRWSVTGDPTFTPPDIGATATLLPGGKVLVVGGGVGYEGYERYVFPYAAQYDPAAATWRPAMSPSWARFGHTATLLQNGKVLVVGGAVESGQGYDNVPSKAELYDPASDSWREVGTDEFRAGHTATLLPDGKVLIAGGNNPQGVRLYEPATETFIGTGYLTAGRLGHTATRLPNGKVLVAGGLVPLEGTRRPSKSTDLYDPDTGTWSPSASLNQTRWGHTAILLPNGNVLVAGGIPDWGQQSLRSAEFFVDVAPPPRPIGPGFTGVWYDPAQSGHGLFVEILPDNRLFAGWFTFNPAGNQQAWFVGTGTYSGNTATISVVSLPTGGRWIPNFDPSQVVNKPWGTLTFTFADCNHGRVDFNSIAGYGSGSMNLTRLTQPSALTCP